MADEPTLYEGDVGVSGWVVEAQRRLTEQGFPLEADGYFGPVTKEAVERYQESVGAHVDGIIGNETWSHLQGRDPEPPGRNNAPYGDTGDDDGDDRGGGDDDTGDGDVPAEVVDLGFPASWSQWTDQQKHDYFSTVDASSGVSGDSPASIEVAAIETGDDEEGLA